MKQSVFIRVLNTSMILMFLCVKISSEASLPKSPDISTVFSRNTFLENKGQWNQEILFQGMSLSTNAYLLKDGISFSQRVKTKNENHDFPTIVWNMKFLNASPEMKIEGAEGKESVYSYLSGSDPAKWVIHPYEFKYVNYFNIYKNIDVQFYENETHLEYDYILHPGSNIHSIRSSFEGIEHLKIRSDGAMEILTDWNIQIQKAPLAWQTINGKKNYVSVEYILINDSTFGFKAKDGYHEDFDLIIDPLFEMVWSSYTRAMGASNNINYCFGNALDRNGNVYLTGMVDGTFPITPGAYSGSGQVSPDVFVAKFSSDGTTLLYSTYLPANSREHGTAIAVDDLGRAYVTGLIELNFTGITDFPSTPNAFQPVHDDGSDAFLTVLNPTGTGLDYSTFIGGPGSETGYALELGGTGIAYVTGSTTADSFPIKASPIFPSGTENVFVVKIDISQSGNNSLIYSTRIGAGSFNTCKGKGIAVNSSGNAFITGKITSSGTPTFPITAGAYNSVFNSGQDNSMIFVTKLSATTPITLEYSTYIAPGTGNAIAVNNATDEAFITGATNTFAFPVTTGVLQPNHSGANGTDAFAVKLNSTGSALIYSTFLGGPFADEGSGIAVNSIGEAYISGIAQQMFPTSGGSYQPVNAGSEDFFVVNLNTTGTGYGCGGATYIGGSGEDYSGSFYDYSSPHISLMDHGGNNDTVLISSTTHSSDFPTTPGVYETSKVNGNADQPVFFKLTCNLQLIPPITYFTSSINTTCDEATVNFTDSTLNNPMSWQWSFPGANPSSSTLQHPQGISFPSSGTYTVKLVSCNSVSCDSTTTSIQINIPQPQVVNLGNDTVICSGNSITLSAPSGVTNNNWMFNGNIIGTNLSTISANQSGDYSISITDTLGCVVADTIMLILSEPAITLGADINLCLGDSILVSASQGFASYQWNVNGNLFGTSSNSIYASQPGTYIVSVTDSIGCLDSDTASAFAGSLTLALIDDTSFCEGIIFILDGGIGYKSYEWRLDGVPISNGNPISITQPGNYFLTVTNNQNCTATDSVQVLLNPLPELELIGDTGICEGRNFILEADIGFTSYQWMLEGVTISNGNSMSITQTGNYVLTVTDDRNCQAADSVRIVINPLPQIEATGDTGICEGDTIILNVTGGKNYTWDPPYYLSSSDSSNTYCYAITDITYVVTGSDQNGCKNSDIVSVSVNTKPVALFDYSVLIDCQGIRVQIINQSIGATQYFWNFGDGFSSTATNPFHDYKELQNETILMIASNDGCNDSTMINNISSDYAFESYLFVPNTFTPNGDGLNNEFIISSRSNCEYLYLEIYNRWGELVYKAEGYTVAWNGYNKSVESPEGVYVYHIKSNSGEKLGHVSLIR